MTGRGLLAGRRAPPRRGRVTSLALLALVACTPIVPDKEPLALALSLRPKPSCDLTPVQYTTDCLAAVEVVVEPESGSPQRTCVPLEGEKRFATLADLLTAEEPVLRFATLTGRGPVVFKVRGIHDRALEDGQAPCDAATSSRHWLLWGESLPVDLDGRASDGGVVDVTISIDCRDCQGGCERVGTAQCPAPMPPAYCVPFSAGFSCARRCDDDAECFEGAIACNDESGRCDPAGGEPGTADTGGFCFPCQDSADCDVGFSCVGAPGASQGLCTRDCPLNRCVSGASCRRLGPNLAIIAGGSSITGVDVGPVDGGDAP